MIVYLSFPSRERGLKHDPEVDEIINCGSFPSRERGLKQGLRYPARFGGAVVPLAGTWIETLISSRPFSVLCPSFPSRERGLKPIFSFYIMNEHNVVPLAGTWIETEPPTPSQYDQMSRSPRGNVD